MIYFLAYIIIAFIIFNLLIIKELWGDVFFKDVSIFSITWPFGFLFLGCQCLGEKIGDGLYKILPANIKLHFLLYLVFFWEVPTKENLLSTYFRRKIRDRICKKNKYQIVNRAVRYYKNKI